ncbi:MAG: DUF364 domain-containing protein [Candidatus Marinimicrobia bacterium]|nr:DUF364 domain-containing protein [Candidatus Neomarinimicrobiota bacterium]
MKLLNRLISDIAETPIEEVIVGVHSVLVKTQHACGIASTIKYCGHNINVQHAGDLESLNLKELAKYALSDNLLEASIGMAAINCGLSKTIGKYRMVNAKEIILKKGKNKTVGIIGHFPFLEEQREQYKDCYIFEKFPHERDLKESDIPTYLPKVDVAAITGTAITNHTFDEVRANLPKNSYNIILGPSTPLSPILFDYGMDMVSGSLIRDYECTRKHVLQATPTRHLKGIEMISIFKEDYQ